MPRSSRSHLRGREIRSNTHGDVPSTPCAVCVGGEREEIPRSGSFLYKRRRGSPLFLTRESATRSRVLPDNKRINVTTLRRFSRACLSWIQANSVHSLVLTNEGTHDVYAVHARMHACREQRRRIARFFTQRRRIIYPSAPYITSFARSILYSTSPNRRVST